VTNRFPIILAWLMAAAALLPAPGRGAAPLLTITAVNRLAFDRPSQTIELSAAQLAPLGQKDLHRLQVKDAAGQDVLCQVVGPGPDNQPALIFQSDFAAGQSRTFTVTTGKQHLYTRADFKAYGRFVRERYDDFAWENDRIAHRMYGKALETCQAEPLTSSAVDVWVKRVSRLVINGWYMMDHYHIDTGEGADLFSAGITRGDGGNGLWAADRLWLSRNFIDTRVLANGPIRVMFELTYPAFDVNGAQVTEVKRISLDAGQNLDHFESFYKPASPMQLTTGIGLRKADVTEHDLDPALGTLTTWEPLKDDRREQSNLGMAVVVQPNLFQKLTEDRENYLILAKAPGNTASYWAGFGWDKSGQFADYSAWKAYVAQFAQGLASPIQVSIQ
jgi:hypothetical protein